MPLTPEQLAEKAKYIREYNRRHPDKAKNTNLKKSFGITLDDYNKMLANQDGVCAICGNPETTPTNSSHHKRVRDLAVDHSHTTGKIRGLLCRGCNQGLGNFRENADLLLRAALYLRLNSV